jgi:hypothetical protein
MENTSGNLRRGSDLGVGVMTPDRMVALVTLDVLDAAWSIGADVSEEWCEAFARDLCSWRPSPGWSFVQRAVWQVLG